MNYFDCHCDYLWAKVNGKTALYEKIKKKGTFCGKTVLAVFEGKNQDRNSVFRQIKAYKDENDTRLGFEGLGWINGLKDAEIILKSNPLYVAPMWNVKNQFGGSCFDDGELTKFGKCFLSVFDERNIFIDLAHAGEYMFYSCIDNFENIIFSHGNVFDICNHKRNLNKRQIRLLIERNSFFGFTFYKNFTGKNGIEDLVGQIDYVLSLGGENILGIGSDIDGCDDLIFNSEENPYEKLCNTLISKNYNKTVIEKMFYLNLKRIENKNLHYKKYLVKK